MDDDTRKGQVLNLLAIPAGLLLLVPLALLFVLWLYLASLSEGLRMLMQAPFGKRKNGVQVSALPKPHFAESRSEVPAKE